jgi:hypothetical protein
MKGRGQKQKSRLPTTAGFALPYLAHSPRSRLPVETRAACASRATRPIPQHGLRGAHGASAATNASRSKGVMRARFWEWIIWNNRRMFSPRRESGAVI